MDGEAPIRLSAADATRANGLHRQREHAAHARHLHACKARLRRFVREHPEQTFIVYQVPLVVVGSALREARSVINHMIHSLRADGFRTEYLGSNLLFISWRSAASDPRYVVQDYVERSLLSPDAATPTTHWWAANSGGGNATTATTDDNSYKETRATRGAAPHLVVPPTAGAIWQHQQATQTERTRHRMDDEIRRRLRAYDVVQ